MRDFLDNEISEILRSLNIDHSMVFLGESSFRIIPLFDDTEFTQIDFDIIDGKTRNHLLGAFEKKKFVIKSARHFIGINGGEYRFAKPAHTLGANPATNLLDALDENAAIFCTPTQALLAMAALGEKRLKEPLFVEDFLLHLPANIKKIVQWIKHDNLKDNFPHSEKVLNEWNLAGIKKRKK